MYEISGKAEMCLSKDRDRRISLYTRRIVANNRSTGSTLVGEIVVLSATR